MAGDRDPAHDRLELCHRLENRARFATEVIKAVRVRLIATRPLSEAISSAGGIRFTSLSDDLMLQEMPGVFCAGEMLDWEAPTGGYLLTACMASGRRAGEGALHWWHQDVS